MENKNANDPINPITNVSHDYLGLTKREYFAAMAMQGIIASGTEVEYGDYGKKRQRGSDGIALWAIQCADELLTQLNNQSK